MYDALMMAITYNVLSFCVGRHRIVRQHRPHVIFPPLTAPSWDSACSHCASSKTDGIKGDHFKGGVTGAIVCEVAALTSFLWGVCERRRQTFTKFAHSSVWAGVELRSVYKHGTVTSESTVAKSEINRCARCSQCYSCCKLHIQFINWIVICCFNARSAPVQELYLTMVVVSHSSSHRQSSLNWPAIVLRSTVLKLAEWRQWAMKALTLTDWPGWPSARQRQCQSHHG